MARFARVCLFVGMGLLLGAAAYAGIPDATNSKVSMFIGDASASTTVLEPAHIVTVPANGASPQRRAEIIVEVRDAGNLVVANSSAFVIFSVAAKDTLCWCTTPAQPNTNMVLGDGRLAFTAVTDVNGIARIWVSGGGCIEDLNVVQIKAGPPNDTDPNNALNLRLYQVVTSFDNGGSGGTLCDANVNTIDFARYAVAHSAVYTTCCDYNGDGAVNTIDFSRYAQQHGRTSPTPVCTGYTGPKW